MTTKVDLHEDQEVVEGAELEELSPLDPDEWIEYEGVLDVDDLDLDDWNNIDSIEDYEFVEE